MIDPRLADMLVRAGIATQQQADELRKAIAAANLEQGTGREQ